MQTNSMHTLSQKTKLALGRFCLVVVALTSFAALAQTFSNDVPSKVAFTPATTGDVGISIATSTSIEPAAELIFEVQRINTTSELNTQLEGDLNIVTEESLLETIPAVNTPLRRPTPSKIAVNPRSSSPTESTMAALLTEEIAIQQTNEEIRQTPDTILRSTASIAPEITRRATPSKIPVNVSNAYTQPAMTNGTLSASISSSNNIPATATLNHLNSSLTAYLSSPSKTPIASLEAQNIRSLSLPLQLDAKSALIIDQDSREILYSRDPLHVMPIASITKLMTAMIILDANQDLNQYITITSADIDTLKSSSSRLAVGTRLTRRDLLHLTLMSSENRAAHALARNYPGGIKAFVAAMNNKARLLGMTQTTYVEPTGLSSENRSTARDLVWLVEAAYKYELIRRLSTSTGHKVTVGGRRLSYINSNRLTDNKTWIIGLQKTGYIREAGYCLVMQTTISGKHLIMIFLDANERKSRITDAENVRQWASL